MRAQVILPGFAGSPKPNLRHVDVHPLKVDTMDVAVWVVVVREKP